MAGYISCQIIGNVGREPNFKYTQSGIAVCDFSVAVTRKIGSGENRKETTQWIRVTCWRGLAEIANQYVKKGTQVFVVGTIDASAYLDKSGQPASSLELTADNFQLLGSRGDGQGGGEYRGGGQQGGGQQGEYDDFRPPSNVDDIPF
ncbi:MAG: single-stranded DNA-binding protein [Chitinophagaceae bacterium]|nr:single-stranded DNA-binding protein [Anaerolineae bacterium]